MKLSPAEVIVGAVIVTTTAAFGAGVAVAALLVRAGWLQHRGSVAAAAAGRGMGRCAA